jgi:hypothetical protein
MFLFLRRQYKLNVWTETLRAHVSHQPLGVFCFLQRFKHLVNLVNRGIGVYYVFEWTYEVVPRKTKGLLKEHIDE